MAEAEYDIRVAAGVAHARDLKQITHIHCAKSFNWHFSHSISVDYDFVICRKNINDGGWHISRSPKRELWIYAI